MRSYTLILLVVLSVACGGCQVTAHYEGTSTSGQLLLGNAFDEVAETATSTATVVEGQRPTSASYEAEVDTKTRGPCKEGGEYEEACSRIHVEKEFMAEW